MNHFTLICYVGIAACSLFVLSQATVGGQYSVNVHFVPPLVTAPCPIAQFWSPPNVTCGMCFCMTGSLSRCIPQPGCNPNSPNNTTTTTTTTPVPNGTDSSSNANGSGNEQNPAQPDANQNETGGGEAPSSTTAASASSTEAEMMASTEDSTSSNGILKTRASKPGKIRRRRHSRNL